MRTTLTRLRHLLYRLATLDRRVDEIKINQGRLLSKLNHGQRLVNLSDCEFKVFSQWGEDGIIQYLIGHLDIASPTFIEFGVEDFFESNCRFLLTKDLWRGFVIDSSPQCIARLRSSDFYWRYPLRAKVAFVTRENVASLLNESGFSTDLGILSIDVDGMDYHLLEALSEWEPSIFIVEFNGLFGYKRAVTVPYDPTFTRVRAHWSNLYWGASLPAFDTLLRQRGYAFVGTNSMASNAFFVQRRLLNDHVAERAVTACDPGPVFREARDRRGKLMLEPAADLWHVIADMPLVDLETGSLTNVRDLFKS